MLTRKLAGLFAICGFFLTGCSSSDNELHLYTWGNYIKPSLLERFEKEHDCRVTIDTYDSNEAMYAKLKAGATGYDILFPSTYIFELMVEQGMLQELDKEKLPNMKELDPFYLAMIPEKQRQAGVPYMLTYTGIAFRKDKTPKLPHSWSVFADTQFKGRMTMLNDMREALGAALKHLGYSINTFDPAQIKKAADLLIQWKHNLAKFESEQYQNGIAGGEYLIAQGYSGDVLQVMQEHAMVGFFLPEEGTNISLDLMVIPQHAPHRELALAFINFLLDPEVAAENIGYAYYICPNLGAYERLPKALRENPALFPDEAIIKKSELIQNLGAHTRLYTEAWDHVKGAEF